MAEYTGGSCLDFPAHEDAGEERVEHLIGHNARADDLAVAVVGIGGSAEDDRDHIGLVVAGEELIEPGGRPHAQGQHPRGEWI